MASSSTSRSSGAGAPFGADFGSGAEAAAQARENMDAAMTRIRELNERAMEAARSAGAASLDAYEKAMQSFVSVEERLAGATQIDWVKAIVGAQAEFVQNLSGAYVTAARDLLAK